jgi:rhamnopyranosyl-N-acetylglucosaminyl-diphospho-decaprenol beta-1,3/1,4-galactofuranosyltransferase
VRHVLLGNAALIFGQITGGAVAGTGLGCACNGAFRVRTVSRDEEGRPVRILVQLHTWNGVDIIGMALDAVLQQTFAVEEILIVDNASTDGTAELVYPQIVTLIRHGLNLGTSGSVKTGIEYARTHGYDWLWVLDADSMPRPDALELLTRLLQAGDLGGDGEIGVVCSSHNLVRLGQMLHGRILTPGGPRMPKLRKDRNYVDCDSVIWSGALINLAVVEQVGLPRVGKHGCWEDLSLDYGDTEYTYRIRRAGYKILVHRDSLIDHPLGRGLHRRILGYEFYTSNHSAFRRYLHFRNLVFFWLRIYHRRNWPVLLIWFGHRMSVMLARIIFLERERGRKVKACLAGVRDGFRGRLDGKFEA